MRKLVNLNKTLLLFAMAFMTLSVANAQQKPVSPHVTEKGTVAGSTITIRYGSPSVRGREIWGKLEPYGKVYRAGADSATTFTTSKDIKVQGKTLPAGKYSFFVVPTENGPWPVIFNKTAEQWGAFKYDEKEDQLRVMVTPKTASMHEQLTYKVTGKGVSFYWDKIELPISVSK